MGGASRPGDRHRSESLDNECEACRARTETHSVEHKLNNTNEPLIQNKAKFNAFKSGSVPLELI